MKRDYANPESTARFRDLIAHPELLDRPANEEVEY